jgi:hypothetical protein
MKRDLLICLSFSNLLAARAWMRVLDFDHGYYMPHAGQNAAFVMLSVLLVAAAGFGMLRWVRKYCTTPLRRKVFAALLGLLIVTIAIPSAAALALLAILFLLSAVVMEGFWIPGVVSRLCLIGLPFVLVTFSQGLWLVIEPKIPHSSVQAAKSATVSRAGTPVVWIIFDELDESVAFEQRPPSIQLPTFDEFKSHAWSAGNALPPANFTEISIPALVTGRQVADTKPSSSRELMLRFSGTKHFVHWSKQSTVFSEATSQGFHVSVVGWFHPYCEVLRGQMDECFQQKTDLGFPPIVQKRLGASILEEIRRAAPIVQMKVTREDENKTLRQIHADEYPAYRAAVMSSVQHFDHGLLYLHLPVPHPPGFYDPRTSQLTTGAADYLDNLVLADRLLREIKSTMQARGTWDTSTVIVTSDHWWRVRMWSKSPMWSKDEEEFDNKADHRIPFMVKLPNQTAPSVYSNPISTVNTRKLVMSMLQGNVKSADDLSAEVESQMQSKDPVFRPY